MICQKEVECTQHRQQIYVTNSKLSSCEQTALLVPVVGQLCIFVAPNFTNSFSFLPNHSQPLKSLNAITANALINYLL